MFLLHRIGAAITAPAALGLGLLILPIAANAQAAPGTVSQAPDTANGGTSTNEGQAPPYSGGVPSGPSDQSTAPPPAPEPKSKPRIILGINAGVFFPTSGKAQNRFGNSWWTTGIGIGSIPKASGHGLLGLDLRTQYQASSGGRHVFVGALGVEYRRRFDPDTSAARQQYVPFYGASIDAMFVDVASPADNVHSGVNTTAGGSVFVGTTIGRQEFVTLRYQIVPDIKGFNFSGVGLSAGVRFY